MAIPHHVVGPTKIISPSPVVTAGAYHANDNIAGILTLSNVVRAPSHMATLNRVSVVDAGNQKAQLEFLFWSGCPTSSCFVNNDAAGINTADVALFAGRQTVYASDYLSVSAIAVATVSNIGMAMQPTSGCDMYLTMMTPGAPTYVTASDLRVSLAFYQD